MRARYVWDYDITEQEFDALLAGRAAMFCTLKVVHCPQAVEAVRAAGIAGC